MDVHQIHANTPITGDGTHQRLSLVSYLRKGFLKKCTGDKKIRPADYFKKLREKIKKKGGRKTKKRKTRKNKKRYRKTKKTRK